MYTQEEIKNFFINIKMESDLINHQGELCGLAVLNEGISIKADESEHFYSFDSMKNFHISYKHITFYYDFRSKENKLIAMGFLNTVSLEKYKQK